MMFNSRYRMKPRKKGSPTFSLQRFGRMYYILKEGCVIKRFADINGERESGNKSIVDEKKSVKKGSWLDIPTDPYLHQRRLPVSWNIF